jgi:site-specific DNA recombinase
MIFAILASFAAEERRVITGRTVAGKKEKAIRGGFAGGAAPLGYVKDRKGGLAINEEEAKIVRQIVSLRKQGLSLRLIAMKLNEVGIVSKRGAKFHPSTIRYILDNPKYRGVIEYWFRHDDERHCLTKGVHAPILLKAA